MRLSLVTAVLAGLASGVDAAAVSKNPKNNVVNKNICQRPDIYIINYLLKKAPQQAEKFCVDVIKVPKPTASRVVVTSTEYGVTETKTNTVTVSTATATAFSYKSTETLTTETLTITDAERGPVVATTTIYSTQYNYPPIRMKRDAVLDERAAAKETCTTKVPTPTALKGVAKEVASQVCKCFLTAPAPVTTTVVEQGTKTVTVDESVTTTEVVTQLTTVYTATRPITETTTTTSTGPPRTATALDVSAVTVTYADQNIPNHSCTYNRYSDGFEVSNSQANDYKDGINQCQAYCNVRPECKFFFFLRFDPARARGADYGFCFIDYEPYDPQYLQCNYPTERSVGFNKN